MRSSATSATVKYSSCQPLQESLTEPLAVRLLSISASGSLVPTSGTHGLLSCPREPGVTTKRTAFAGGSLNGSDGTRTRDLRRDRVDSLERSGQPGSLRRCAQSVNPPRMPRRPVERPQRAAHSAGIALLSECRRAPSTPAHDGCRPWRSCAYQTCGADHETGVAVVPRSQVLTCTGVSAQSRPGSRRRFPGNTRSSSPAQCSRWPSWASAEATSGAIGTARTFPDFGVVSAPAA